MVRGVPASRAATLVEESAPIALAGPPSRFVSRGGDKLDGALQRLEIRVAGRRWADVGASTGGFTDCLLQRGAGAVLAIDVGYGQLDWRLRGDTRVVVLERTNIRSLDNRALPWKAEGVVADLAFISLSLVLADIAALADPAGDFVLLVKPQFELGRRSVGKGGVVRRPDEWRRAMQAVVTAGEGLGLHLAGAVASSIPGPAGNREFFVHLHRDGSADPDRAIERAVSEAPA